MSIWNRIGDAAKAVGGAVETAAKDVWQLGTAVPRFAWDVGTSLVNDNEQWNGFSNTLDSATKRLEGNIAPTFTAIGKIPGLNSALNTVQAVNRNLLYRPATTINLAEDAFIKSPLSYFDPNMWKKAWNASNDISLGQAIAAPYAHVFNNNFNIYDPAQREETFKKNAFGRIATGSLDVYKDVMLDLTLGGSKALKALKASELGVGAIKTAEDAAKAAEDITKAQNGVKNRFTPVLEDFAKNDKTYAINHPMVRSSSNPGLLAHLLGDSKDTEQVGTVLRAAIGDPHAMIDLAAKRADMSDALKAARGDLAATDQFKLFSAPDGSGMLPFMHEDPVVIQQAEENYKALAQNDQRFAQMMELGQGGGVLRRTAGTLSQPLEDFVANSRSLKYYDKTPGNAKVEVFQPTPFHRMYQKVSWAAGERPAGVIDLNDADSYKEVMATLDRATKTGAIDETGAKGLLDKYISANTPESRANVILNLESTVSRAMAQMHGIDIDMADQMYNDFKRARTSAFKSIKDRGYMIDPISGDIIKVPQFESQTMDHTSIMDFDLLNKVLKRNAASLQAIGPIKVIAGRAADTFIHYADLTQDLFKAGALLRLGYTLRNGLDSQLRIASSVGSLASLQHLGPGLKNIIFNTKKDANRLIDNYNIKGGARTFKDVEVSRAVVTKQLKEADAEIAAAKAKLSLDPNNTNLITQVNTLEMLRAEKQGVYDHYVDVLNKNKGALPKQKIGSGSFEYTSSDGNVYTIDDAFGGKLGPMFRNMTSSARSFERIVDSNSDLIGKNVSSKGIGAVYPEDIGYHDQWAQTLNRQFGNSAVIKKIVALKPGEGLDDVTRWLVNSPEGRDLRGRLELKSDDAAEYVTKANQFLDHYLPATSGLRNKLGQITANDLRSAFKDPTTQPTIHGHVLEDNLNNVDIIHIRNFINNTFKFLGTLPEDAWARHPLYVKLYRDEVKRRIDVLEGLKNREEFQAIKGAPVQKDRVTRKEQEDIMAAAHKTAVRDMKGILFNIERRSNLAAAMKYISPFFSAQENAYKTWMKMAVANPAIINRGNLIWNAPNRAGLVTDQNGKEVPAGQATANDTIWLQMPKGVKNIPFVGKGLESLDNMGIPKKSLDVVFGGGMDAIYNKGTSNAFSDVFPVGPYVATPISQIVKNQPTLEDAFKWALPYGPSKGLLDGFMPAWIKRAQTEAAGQSSPEYARTFQLIWNTEAHKLRQNGQDVPSNFENKIQKMTDDYYKMRMAANLILPFSPKFDSPYRLYMDKYRELRRQDPMTADAKFLDPDTGYPDFFEFATSLSQNKTGVQSSPDAIKVLQTNKDLVSKLYGLEPALVGLIANNPTGYNFSQASYDWLYNTKVSPSRQETFLGNQSAADAQAKNEAKKGWVIYRDIVSTLNEAVKARGLTNINSRGAEDLKQVKDAVIESLSYEKDAQGNQIVDPKTGQLKQTAWYRDYKDTDGSKTNRVIEGLGAILADEKFMKSASKNPTWQSVGVYLDLRKEIAKELAGRKIKTITAKANSDIKDIYDSVVSTLTDPKTGDAGFSDLYDRFLTQDLIYDKYLTPKAVK